jgi:hypothetical protein
VITDTDIFKAFEQKLLTFTPALTIGWPNKDVPAGTPHPFLIFDHVPVSRVDNTLTGGGEFVRGFAQITVMAKPGEFATRANRLADQIAALFPYTLRLPVTGGEITISQPPEVQQGYPDGAHWRVPVKIPYFAI